MNINIIQIFERILKEHIHNINFFEIISIK